MESLESKLDRLSPDQRRKVEDFVDFLLYRSGSPQGVYSPNSTNPPVIPVMAPIIIQETLPVTVYEQNIQQEEPSSLEVPEEHSSTFQEITIEVEDRITRDYMDYGQFEEQQSPANGAEKKVKVNSIRKGRTDKSNHLLDWVD